MFIALFFYVVAKKTLLLWAGMKHDLIFIVCFIDFIHRGVF